MTEIEKIRKKSEKLQYKIHLGKLSSPHTHYTHTLRGEFDKRPDFGQFLQHPFLIEKYGWLYQPPLNHAYPRAFDAHASFLNDARIPVPDSRALNAYFTRI